MQIKNLFKVTLILSMLAISLLAGAQQMQRKTPEERAQNQVRWMQNNLGLTKEQNNKVYDIILRHAKEVDDANANIPAGRDKKMEKGDIMKARESELRAVLNADQYQKYEAHMQEMKARMKERRGGGFE